MRKLEFHGPNKTRNTKEKDQEVTSKREAASKELLLVVIE